MIMPTLERVRKNSSSSSIAIMGAGIFPFMTPISMILRGSTWPVIVLFALGSGARPTAPFGSTRLLKIETGSVPRTPARITPQTREGTERKHIRLGPVRHRRKAVTARNLLALDGALVGNFRRVRVKGRGSRTLNAKSLSARGPRRDAHQQY